MSTGISLVSGTQISAAGSEILDLRNRTEKAASVIGREANVRVPF